MPAFRADFQVGDFQASRKGQGLDLRVDVEVGMHVVELARRVVILDAQPGLAVCLDDSEFLVLRNVESLRPVRVYARILKISLRQQVRLRRGRFSRQTQTNKHQKPWQAEMRGSEQSQHLQVSEDGSARSASVSKCAGADLAHDRELGK